MGRNVVKWVLNAVTISLVFGCGGGEQTTAAMCGPTKYQRASLDRGEGETYATGNRTSRSVVYCKNLHRFRNWPRAPMEFGYNIHL